MASRIATARRFWRMMRWAMSSQNGQSPGSRAGSPPSMDIAVLKERFGEKLTFCGSVCVQTTLAWHTPDVVEREIRRRLDLFPDGGLFLGPTHAVQVGSPLENTLTMYRTAGSLREEIDDSILSIQGGEGEVDKIDLAKLF